MVITCAEQTVKQFRIYRFNLHLNIDNEWEQLTSPVKVQPTLQHLCTCTTHYCQFLITNYASAILGDLARTKLAHNIMSNNRLRKQLELVRHCCVISWLASVAGWLLICVVFRSLGDAVCEFRSALRTVVAGTRLTDCL